MRILPSHDSWHVVERRVLDLPNTSGDSGAHNSNELPTLPSELVDFLDSTKQMVSKLEHCNKYRVEL
jgi:hypothetical protein